MFRPLGYRSNRTRRQRRQVQFYGGVKRPHPTIHSRHVYNSRVTSTISRHVYNSQPPRLRNNRHVYNSQPSRLQFTPSRLQNTRHVYKTAVTPTIHSRHAYKSAVTSTIQPSRPQFTAVKSTIHSRPVYKTAYIYGILLDILC